MCVCVCLCMCNDSAYCCFCVLDTRPAGRMSVNHFAADVCMYTMNICIFIYKYIICLTQRCL